MYFDKPKLMVDMHVEGREITHFLSFQLTQSFNAHHYFELRLEHGKLGLPGLINLEDTRDFVGRSLAVSFGYDRVNTNDFSGLITNVSLSQRDGYQGEIVITGYSPTILIDRGPDLGSYLERSLSDIVNYATKDLASGDLYLNINPKRKHAIDYVIQYRESDFAFLNRLSAEYYEWFYYDGAYLKFGKPDELPQATLTYGQEISALDYGINIAPIKHKRFYYDPKVDEMYSSESKGDSQGGADLAHAIDRSNTMYRKTFHQPAIPRIDSSGDLEEFVQNEEKANISQLLTVSGQSDSPLLRLGVEVQIDTSIRQDLNFVKDTLGKFLMTSVSHNIDGVGRYSNSFEGILANTDQLPVRHYDRPSPDLQLAEVIDNTDPKGQGRIKVRFKWECEHNDDSEWLRVISPNAGSGDTGSNRGFMVIPEKGDQVVIAFEEGNVARPVVMGSVYHGKSGDSKAFSNSDVKGLTSRKGSALTFDDLNHALNLGTNQSNFVNIKNGDGSVTMEAAETITIKTGGSSITLKKDGTINLIGKIINIQGTEAINVNADKMTGAVVNIGKSGSTDVKTEVKTYSLTADTDVSINAKSIKGTGSTIIDFTGAGGTVKIHGQVDIN